MADTCISCSEAAQYSYQTAPSSFMLFCPAHVPGFLKGKNGRLLLKSLSAEQPVAPSTKTSKKKKSEPVIEEAVTDEVATEESPLEEIVTEE